MVKASRYDSFPLLVFVVADHGESLASACLSVSEHSAIETLKGVFYDAVSTRLINLVLSGIETEDIVEDEIFDIGTFSDTKDVVFGFYTKRGFHFGLSFVEGAHSQCYLD